MTRFPFEALPTLTRQEVTAAAHLRSIGAGALDLATAERVAAELLGEQVHVEVSAQRSRRAEAAAGGDAVGVVFGPGDDAITASARALVRFEAALAATIVAKALRNRTPRIVAGERAGSPPIAGALAAVLSAVTRGARRSPATPLRVIAAGPGDALARDLTLAAGSCSAVTLTVTIGDASFLASVTVPDAAGAAGATTERWTREALVRMGDAPLSLALVCATTTATRRDLLALRTGDVFVPGGLAIPAGTKTCPVLLVAPRAEVGLAADLAEGGRLVLRGEGASAPWSEPPREEPAMTDPAATATLEALEDAPVVVRVELGAVEMRARDWAAIAPGDVVSLGRKLGEPAILRVAGVEIARGELVLVDGEYAVRVLDRTREEA